MFLIHTNAPFEAHGENIVHRAPTAGDYNFEENLELRKRFAGKLFALFGAFFNQTFGEKDKAAHLHPFGDGIADDLPPFAVDVHFPK